MEFNINQVPKDTRMFDVTLKYQDAQIYFRQAPECFNVYQFLNHQNLKISQGKDMIKIFAALSKLKEFISGQIYQKKIIYFVTYLFIYFYVPKKLSTFS